MARAHVHSAGTVLGDGAVTSIRERDAAWQRAVERQGGRTDGLLCRTVAEDRRLLLAAGDALALGADLLVNFDPSHHEPQDAAWAFPHLLGILRNALARWQEVTG